MKIKVTMEFPEEVIQELKKEYGISDNNDLAVALQAIMIQGMAENGTPVNSLKVGVEE